MNLLLLASLLCAATASALTADPVAPANFYLDFATDIDGVGKVTLNITRALAPLGVDRLHALVADHFFDGAAFFRVDGGFVLQFGIAGTPAENAKWVNSTIKDDPVVVPNMAWTMSFAKTSAPNSRSTQLFINYGNNQQLDGQGFAPVGVVIEGSQYLLRVHDPTPGNPQGVDQTKYETLGNTWIREQYPEINFIKSAAVRIP